MNAEEKEFFQVAVKLEKLFNTLDSKDAALIDEVRYGKDEVMKLRAQCVSLGYTAPVKLCDRIVKRVNKKIAIYERAS